jgi:uncharacterized membrane protein
MRTVLIAIEMLAASIWIGSLVCLAIVSAAAGQALDPQARVALFRQVGRLYGVVGTGSLLAAIAAGVALAWPMSHIDATLGALFALAAVLLLATMAGMAQARRMTAHRQRLLSLPSDGDAAERVRRGAALARVLRGSLALISAVMLALGARLLGR